MAPGRGAKDGAAIGSKGGFRLSLQILLGNLTIYFRSDSRLLLC